MVCGKCDKKCLSCSYYSDNCLTCNEGWYFSLNACQACDSSCKSCKNYALNCITCPSGKYLDDNSCFFCYHNCKECSGKKSTDCTSCGEGRHLVDGACEIKPVEEEKSSTMSLGLMIALIAGGALLFVLFFTCFLVKITKCCLKSKQAKSTPANTISFGNASTQGKAPQFEADSLFNNSNRFGQNF